MERKLSISKRFTRPSNKECEMKFLRSWNVLIMIAAIFLIGAMVQQSPPGSTIYFRELNQYGYNPGITVGTAWPTAANSGQTPLNGEIAIVVDGTGTISPRFGLYSQADTQFLPSVVSTLVTNAPNVANSVWAASGGIVLEGTTANAYEFFLTTADVTADIIYQIRDDAADTYYPIAVPDDTLTTSQFTLPSGIPVGAASAEDALAGDLDVVCYREYLPYPITVTEIILYEFQATSAGSSDFLGAAIYEDADAGVQLTEGATVYAADGAALVLDVADVTLEPDFYRFCATQNDVSAQDWGAFAQAASLAAVQGETAGECRFCKATNDSTGDADMPATTGALTASTEAMPVMQLQSN